MTTGKAEGFAQRGIETTDHDGVLVSSVTGEIDVTNADHTRDALAAMVDQSPSALIVDLAVDFIGSVGLSALVEIHQRAQQAGVGFAVVAAGRVVRRPLAVTGLDQLLGLYDSVAEAVEELRRRG